MGQSYKSRINAHGVEPMPGDVAAHSAIAKVVSILEYSSAYKFRLTCKSLYAEVEPLTPDALHFMRALYSAIHTIRSAPRVATLSSFTCKDLIVSVEGRDCLCITCVHAGHPYVNMLSNIGQTEGSRFKMSAVYTNLLTGYIVHTTLEVTAPWHVHGRIRNAEGVLLGRLPPPVL
jgi:hypothetical protein